MTLDFLQFISKFVDNNLNYSVVLKEECFLQLGQEQGLEVVQSEFPIELQVIYSKSSENYVHKISINLFDLMLIVSLNNLSILQWLLHHYWILSERMQLLFIFKQVLIEKIF